MFLYRCPVEFNVLAASAKITIPSPTRQNILITYTKGRGGLAHSTGHSCMADPTTLSTDSVYHC